LNIPGPNINKNDTKKRVLVAPLDWGLGHATRCVPVIREFIRLGFQVLLAGENAIAQLLKEEFPELTVLHLKGYRIRYGKNRRSFVIKMFLQLPKILRCIKEEKKWLEKIIASYNIDIVFSDNRFGLYSTNAHCIFMTHQLFIKTGNSFTEKIAQKINYRYINRFDECWVPDNAGAENLAGILSHPAKMPELPVKYIGILSRFTKQEFEKKYDLAAVLSGPEPQRSFFEDILLKQIKGSSLNAVVVRGLPCNTEIPAIKTKILNHLPAAALNELILSSRIVISRSGYSTLMDLATIGTSAILVPTPGQTEQEYLAEYLSGKNYFISAPQEGLQLQEQVKKIELLQPMVFPNEKDKLSEAITALL
jgi:UDP-N-acetylglucosamine transferase subunit ALG13